MQSEMLALARRRAGPHVLRLETAEDLVQGICAHVLERGIDPALDSDAKRRAWLLRVASNYIADRRDHWTALRRDGSRVLRMSFAEGVETSYGKVADLAASVTGPSTFAVRREQVSIAALALDMLLPRDRELIEGLSKGLSIDEQAAALKIGYEACERARLRAIERFRRTFKLALQGRG